MDRKDRGIYESKQIRREKSLSLKSPGMVLSSAQMQTAQTQPHRSMDSLPVKKMVDDLENKSGHFNASLKK